MHLFPRIDMSTITIDNQEYDLDSLSDDAKSQLQMLQFSDQEISRLNAQLAIVQTARMAYSKALMAALPAVPMNDTIKLS
ncbi:MAG: hypothetical protein RIR25_293 [Verrucomicrobiota bacterium]